MKWNAGTGSYELTEAEFKRVTSWEASDGFGDWYYHLRNGGAILHFGHRGGRGSCFEDDMARYCIYLEGVDKRAESKSTFASQLAERAARACALCEHEHVRPGRIPCKGCCGAGSNHPNFTPKSVPQKEQEQMQTSTKTSTKKTIGKRVDKHDIADAIELAVSRCLNGNYTGRIADCEVCEIMGHTGTDGNRSVCFHCPLGPNVPVDSPEHYGCYEAMKAIVDKKPGAAARVYQIIDALRCTLGDDQWIEILTEEERKQLEYENQKERERKSKAALASHLEMLLGSLLSNLSASCPAPGSYCAFCPIRNSVCGSRLDCIRDRRGNWTKDVLLVAKAILDLREQSKPEGEPGDETGTKA